MTTGNQSGVASQHHEMLQQPLTVSRTRGGGDKIAVRKKKRKAKKGKNEYISPRKPDGRRSTKRTKINSNRGIGCKSLSDSPASVLETLGGGTRQKRSGREMEACNDDNNNGMMGFDDDEVDGDVGGSTSSSRFTTHTEGGSGGDDIDSFENQDDDDDEVCSSTSDNDAPISELMYSRDGSREGPGRRLNMNAPVPISERAARSSSDSDAAIATNRRRQLTQPTGMLLQLTRTVRGKRNQHPERKQHVCDRVQLYVKAHLFRKVKFIKDEDMLMELMVVVEQTERFRDRRSREHFKAIYKGVVMEAINIRRSACDQTGGRIMDQYFSTHVTTKLADGTGDHQALATLHAENLHFFELDTICKLRQANTTDEIKAFNWFFGEFMECVSGKRVWSRHKYHNLISEAVNRDTGVQIITVSDEAFGLLLLENYLDKWKKKFVAKANGVVLEKKLDGKYTASSKGNYAFGGWSKAGQKRFNYYVRMVKEDRASAKAKEMETKFLLYMQQTPAGKKIHEKMQLMMLAAERRGADSEEESDCDVYIEPL